jgi:hypothetical protein
VLPGRFPKRRIADSDPSPVAATRPSGDQQRAELLPDRLRVGLLGIYRSSRFGGGAAVAGALVPGPMSPCWRDRVASSHPYEGGEDMAFVQIIEFRTSNIDEMRKLEEEWEAAAGTESTARRVITGADRDDSGRYLQVVFFDSYESAMENSNLPVTQEFSQKMMALSDGSPTFYNLDVVDDRTMA